MSTTAQIAANQVNAQHSTGPKTEQGKAIASLNNLRHGFNGSFTVMPWESQDEFDFLFIDLRVEYKPVTVTETVLVEKMAQAMWLGQRAVLLQQRCFNPNVPVCDNEKLLALYLRYQTTHDRAFHRCLNELLRLRAEKRKQEIGFESQKRKQEEESRKAADQNRREASENRKQELHRYNVLLAEAKADHQDLLNMNLQHSIDPLSTPKSRSIESQKAA
jgi:low affinity Fe/Cu permease